MLRLAQTFLNTALLSIRTGGPIGTVEKPIINPENLHIDGWYCKSQFAEGDAVLLPQDIRETVMEGFIINDYEALAEPEELVRLRKVIDQRFELLGKKVVTNHGRRLGKVSDYSIDTESFYVKKLYVDQALLRNPNGGLSIDRQQIIEITDDRVVVRDSDIPVTESSSVLQRAMKAADYPAAANSSLAKE